MVCHASIKSCQLGATEWDTDVSGAGHGLKKTPGCLPGILCGYNAVLHCSDGNGSLGEEVDRVRIGRRASGIVGEFCYQ